MFIFKTTGKLNFFYFILDTNFICFFKDTKIGLCVKLCGAANVPSKISFCVWYFFVFDTFLCLILFLYDTLKALHTWTWLKWNEQTQLDFCRLSVKGSFTFENWNEIFILSSLSLVSKDFFSISFQSSLFF
jgi:hypothetical protein